MTDEILQEVRSIKEALAREAGFDIRRLAEEIRKSEQRSAKEGRQHIPAPATPRPPSPFQKARFG